jgi:thioredoxin reductase
MRGRPQAPRGMTTGEAHMADRRYDVVVVGGGAAGLSGALALARSRRSVLVVDDGTSRNATAGHVHNYLGREGSPPAELLAVGRDEVIGYGGDVITGTVVSVRAGFRVVLRDGRSVQARRLLVTTGLRDDLPDVPGLAERWGRDVLHCPYCHGWEVRDQALGILATGPTAVHQALLFRQLSDDIVLFQHTAALTGDEQEQLASRGIAQVEGKVAGLDIIDDRITGVRLVSGDSVARQAVVVGPRFSARSDAFSSIGLEPAEYAMNGLVLGTHIASDPTGATAVAGVWVAGNVTDPRATVIGSAAAGLNAAAAINADLVAEETRYAVAVHRSDGMSRAR